MEALQSIYPNVETAAQECHILRVSCAAEPGIVAAVTTTLAACGGNLVESAQFLDESTDRFFLRIGFLAPLKADIATALAPVQERFGFGIDLEPATRKPRLIIMVSKFDHALLHLLYQIRVGWLHADVVAIISNHPCARDIATHEGVPFHHWPVTRETKPDVEAKLLDLADTLAADLVVLARYMQVLSDDVTQRLSGRAINIHHSFLPSFKGAKPYHQAHARGVKHIGATAHYVTADLDEGPIIEQDVERKTRFAVLFRNNDRSSTHFMRRLMDVMEPLPQPARKSITFDRGFEFREWRKLKSGIGTDSWFCDPQAPWQKGSVENLNKRARRYLPRDTQLAALSNRNMKAICDRLNGTPR